MLVKARGSLNWLRARERITFKLCLLVYKARNGTAPNYILDFCVPVTSVPTRAALRSAASGDLALPRTRLHLRNHTFCVALAGLTSWNSLPSDNCISLLSKTILRLVCFCSLTLYLDSYQHNSSSVCCTVPCSDFTDMLRHLIN